ncbi:MAG TPA: thioredoxin family protein [Dissulfurispiraceae bacterium]|nr:thioredoxin family protein [Dissulfurispiraceae bacterium]
MKKIAFLLTLCFCFTLLNILQAYAAGTGEPPVCKQSAQEPCADANLQKPASSVLPKIPVSPAPAVPPRESRASEPFTVYFFEGEGCPHCDDAKKFLAEMKKTYPKMRVLDYEVWHNRENAQVLGIMAKAHGIQAGSVPVTFIGLKNYVGFSEQTKESLRKAIQECAQKGCPDPADRLTRKEPEAAGASALQAPATPEQPETAIDVPLFGKIDAASLSLPLMTVVIAGLDSFNPCAFFVLFSLLGILIHAHSRAKMLLIGVIFVFFSGFIYFLFMAAWLNVFLLLGSVALITTGAGIVSIIIAAVNIKDFFWFKEGVSLTIPDSAKPKLFDRMRKLLKASSLPSIIAGTVVLAIAANSYELLCTAGFPMVFTRILTLNQLPTGTYYAYLALYNVIYVIPLATIVCILCITLGKRQLSEWEGRVLKLVSGTMMLGLGFMLVGNPALLNNIFVSFSVLSGAVAISAIIAVLAKKRAAGKRRKP